jgi:hypothetical protein
MNLCLFVTKESLASLPPIVERMSELQQEVVNGACIVVHDALVKPADLAFTIPLARRFKVAASLPAQINTSTPQPIQMAALFSRLLTTAYARYPGPWLLFDEPADPKMENFMQAALRQHGEYGGKMTGRAITHPGSAVPVGPVTLEIDFKHLRFLRFPTRQSWRERGQFLFPRAGFQLVPAAEWLFDMKRVEATQPEIRAIFHEGKWANPSEVDFGDPNPAYATPPPEDMSDDELRSFIEVATGKKPHHFTGRDKMIQMATGLKLTPA